jgi:hypothetical protein
MGACAAPAATVEIDLGFGPAAQPQIETDGVLIARVFATSAGDPDLRKTGLRNGRLPVPIKVKTWIQRPCRACVGALAAKRAKSMGEIDDRLTIFPHHNDVFRTSSFAFGAAITEGWKSINRSRRTHERMVG